MYTLDIWVPTKGWTRIAKNKDRETIHRRAVEFHPLETKVTLIEGKRSTICGLGGRHCMPKYDEESYGIANDGCDQEYLDKILGASVEA